MPLIALLFVFGSSSTALAQEQTVEVRMRDGVTIATYFKTPSGEGPWPAVLAKGYGISKGAVDTFNQAGYAYVSQGVRSGPDPHGISGNPRFFADDVDGYDTIEWIARQPWCDGKVAMCGPSYWGATQWIAAANGDPGIAADPAQVVVPMRDGVQLKTTVWVPGDGAYPVVLTRGYSPTGLGGAAGAWNRNGYAFVSQQTRGNGGEDGSRFFPDDKDGYDCIQWIAEQPWCNGKVAMWGGSYWGITQWRAALAQPPALGAIVPGYTSSAHRDWVNGYWNRGALHLKMTTQGRVFSSASNSAEEWKAKLMFLPLIDMDKQFSGRENILWNDYMKHSSYDDYWKAIGMAEGGRYEKIRIPVYVMVGWRDYYSDSSFAAFGALKKLGLSPDVRIRVDDGGHSGTPDFSETVRFLDHHLKGLDTGIHKEPPIKILVRHGGWEQLTTWPPPGVRFTKYYLSSPGGGRDGTLTTQPPRDESPTKYTYDPSDPVLTLGANGSHVYPEVPGLITDDPVDQRPNESRPDVLVFTSAPLAGDTKVIGPIEARLYATSSARDSDFVVRLIDVYPDGRALNITEGIVRARFRNGHAFPPSLITPGRIYEYTIALLPMAIVFGKGHRIRVHLTSSCFPLWDRNPNTGNTIGMDAELQTAEQTIYHDRERPSHIVLPLIPAHKN